LKKNKKEVLLFFMDSKAMRSRPEQNMKGVNSFLIDKMKLKNKILKLRKLLMEALFQPHHKEAVPLPTMDVSAASPGLVETAPVPVPIPQDIETATATAAPISQEVFF
jgi:hypothetical protein